MTTSKIPNEWNKWCKTGKHKGTAKKNAVLACLKRDHVRGYFSDILLNPKLKNTNSMYPSVEHLGYPKNSKNVVVEARIFNDMKSHLSEEEFWRVIEHLFAVGVKKGKIKAGKHLHKKWKPKRNYTRKGRTRISSEGE